MEISKRLYLRIREPLINLCIKLHLSSNKLSLLNHFLTLTLGCYFLSRGNYWSGLCGLGICFLNGLLDYLDGDVARKTKSLSLLGAWLDSGFDVIEQNIVMGAIAIGCYKQGLPLIWIVLFFIGNSANNFVSFNYNARFGFDSDKGNQLFRELMNKKGNLINAFFKNIIDPTTSIMALVAYTYRYWIVLGYLCHIMPSLFIMVTIISNFKWVVMYCLYALYLTKEKRLFVLQALACLDKEREEHYVVRLQDS